MDMMTVSLYGTADEIPGSGQAAIEYRTQMSLWSMLNSPLILGADVRNLDSASLETLNNAEVIALNQDSLGIQASKVRDDGDTEIFAKPLADGSWGVALLNRNSSSKDITVNWQQDLGVHGTRHKSGICESTRTRGCSPAATPRVCFRTKRSCCRLPRSSCCLVHTAPPTFV